MEIQLQELIDKIRKDGVEAAEVQAEAILNAAKAEAQKMIADAQTAADKIVTDAKNENIRMVKSSEDAIRQAGRNLLISFRESVARELKAIVGESVAAAYSSQSLEQIIINVVERWASAPETENLTVILNGDDLERLEKTLLASLKERMQKGITLKANDNFDGGFRIVVGDGTVYYDYSTQAVVEMLSNYLSPKVAQLMKEAE
ncbi:MAG: V-type ATP synthase subunit E [Clostridia bacterium]|nr:V-type ATP synthase subunit E [Clostridia bacterium]